MDHIFDGVPEVAAPMSSEVLQNSIEIIDLTMRDLKDVVSFTKVIFPGINFVHFWSKILMIDNTFF